MAMETILHPRKKSIATLASFWDFSLNTLGLTRKPFVNNCFFLMKAVSQEKWNDVGAYNKVNDALVFKFWRNFDSMCNGCSDLRGRGDIRRDSMEKVGPYCIKNTESSRSSVYSYGVSVYVLGNLLV